MRTTVTLAVVVLLVVISSAVASKYSFYKFISEVISVNNIDNSQIC